MIQVMQGIGVMRKKERLIETQIKIPNRRQRMDKGEGMSVFKSWNAA